MTPRHGTPHDPAARPRERTYLWRWDLPATPRELWPLVSDTDRFNRDTGLPPVEDAREEGEELAAARRRLRLAVGPVALEWEEMPFEWVRPRRFGVVRWYRRGPLAEMRVLAELEPLPGGGTRLTYRVAARPAGLLGSLALPIQIGVLSRRRFGRVFRDYGRVAAARAAEEGRARGGPPPPRSPLPEPGPGRRRLARLVGDLAPAGVPEETARLLAHHLATADDGSLHRMRPYLLADLWARPRRELLEACLHATRAGYLSLHWDVLCPLCRGVQASSESLAELRRRGVHCDTCLVDFGGDFQSSVELTFRPLPAVRPVAAHAFCVAGPQVTPYVVVQQLLAPGETREVRPALEPGRYRLRSHGSAEGVALEVVADGSAEAAFHIEGGGWRGGPTGISAEPRLALANGTGDERLVVLERLAWGDDAVTAAEVTRLGVFRDLFSSEVLAAGDFAEVGALALLFTDLRASTRLYRAVGDAPAFGRVMEHFELLEAAVREEDGAVVKTIGDAVMAAFATPAAAVRAAVAAHGRLRSAAGRAAGSTAGSAAGSTAGRAAGSTARRTAPSTAGRGADAPDGRLVLKAGVHAGPCIAVTLNGRLDYFGTTVNVAARMAEQSLGDDLVLTDAVRSDPEVAELLAARGLSAEPSAPRLRGLEDEEVRAWRVVL